MCRRRARRRPVALEQEQRRAFAHDKAVGAVGEGTGAGGRQRADLAELDEGDGAHVAVDAAGDDRVEVRGDQAFDRGVHGGQDEAQAASVM